MTPETGKKPQRQSDRLLRKPTKLTGDVMANKFGQSRCTTDKHKRRTEPKTNTLLVLVCVVFVYMRSSTNPCDLLRLREGFLRLWRNRCRRFRRFCEDSWRFGRRGLRFRRLSWLRLLSLSWLRFRRLCEDPGRLGWRLLYVW